MLTEEKILYEFGQDLVFTTHRVLQGVPPEPRRSIRLEEVRAVKARLGNHPVLAVLALLLFGAGVVAGVPGLVPHVPAVPGPLDLPMLCFAAGAAALGAWAMLRPRLLIIISPRERITVRAGGKAELDRMRQAVESARGLRVLSLIQNGRLAEAAQAVAHRHDATTSTSRTR